MSLPDFFNLYEHNYYIYFKYIYFSIYIFICILKHSFNPGAKNLLAILHTSFKSSTDALNLICPIGPQKRSLWCSLSATGEIGRGSNFYIPLNLLRNRFSRKTLISATGPACFEEFIVHWRWQNQGEVCLSSTTIKTTDLQTPLKFKMCATICNWLTE